MQKDVLKRINSILMILIGCAIYSFGFDLFLVPYGLNAGGLAGLTMLLTEVTGIGSVGLWTVVFNVPLFILGWKVIGRDFFIGSLIGMLSMSAFIDLFARIPVPQADPMLASLYGGALTGSGLGIVFMAGASSGGSDIIVRLLKRRWQNVPVGKLNLVFDSVVAVLTGIVFHSMTNILYCGIVLYLFSVVMDAVVYRFDYSKAAIIISPKYEEIARGVWSELDRGVTYLYGSGAWSKRDQTILLVAVKRRQVAELKNLVTKIDPDAFTILLESHQVLGDGFAHYSKNAL